MLEVSPAETPLEPRSLRPVREYRSPSRAGVAAQIVLLVVATTLVVGFAAASAFAGLLYRLSSIAR